MIFIYKKKQADSEPKILTLWLLANDVKLSNPYNVFSIYRLPLTCAHDQQVNKFLYLDMQCTYFYMHISDSYITTMYNSTIRWAVSDKKKEIVTVIY